MLLSCEKKNITGTVKDNLGNPLENIQVSVKNTDFKAQTNSNGNFSLEYVPGEIYLIIEEDGYLGFQEHYVISEKSKYPLGEINLFKIPETKALFLISSEGYIPVTKSTMSSTKTKKKDVIEGLDIDMGLDVDVFCFTIKRDSIFTISPLDKVIVDFIDCTDIPLRIVKVGLDSKVASYKVGGLFGNSIEAEYCTEEVEQINNKIRIRKVAVERGQVYAFINIYDDFHKGKKMSSLAYAFKIE